MINPLVLIFGTGSFLASFITHILIWRMAKPSKQFIWLAVIFIILPILIYILLFYFSYISVDHNRRFIANPHNITFIILWHSLLSVAYIMFYLTMRLDNKLLKIIRRLMGLS